MALLDGGSATEEFLRDVVTGLAQPQKVIPCKYFYDKRGSELFDRICELPEYYPTRTEMGIMRASGGEIAEHVGPHRLVVEYGSGSSLKTRLLLDALEEPAGYVPIDISGEHLEESVSALREEYPGLPVHPVCADYTEEIALPEAADDQAPLVYFPGSTIGNFAPDDAVAFLKRLAKLAGPAGGALIGVDLKKDRERLERAYDDAQGVTAAFNRNVLLRMQNELDAELDAKAFEHRAVYNEDQGRVEMHLVSTTDQEVRLGGEHAFRLDAGETIRTEYSYKYDLNEFAALAYDARLAVENVWTDPGDLFSVQYLTAA
jgi:dimethylhistidine N-methyltransferase